jgi:hypothetical protein
VEKKRGAHLEPARLGSRHEAVEDVTEITHIPLLRGLLHAGLDRRTVKTSRVRSSQATSARAASSAVGTVFGRRSVWL